MSDADAAIIRLQLDRIETMLQHLLEMLERYMGESAQGRGLGH